MLGKSDSHMQKNETGHFLTPYTKIDPKWMKDLNVRQESIKTLEENKGSNLCDLGHTNFLIHTSPDERETKAKTNHWYFIKIKKKLLPSKGNSQQN